MEQGDNFILQFSIYQNFFQPFQALLNKLYRRYGNWYFVSLPYNIYNGSFEFSIQSNVWNVENI